MLSIGGFILLLGCLCHAKKLPDYITPCHVSDPNLGECIEKRANEVVPILVKEDETFNFPSLSPFAVKLSVPSDKTFKFELQGKGVGLEAAQIRNSRFKIEELVVRTIFYIPQIVVTGPYKIEGRIRGKEINTTGVATITFDIISFDYIWTYNIYKKNELDYMKTVNTNYTYEIKQSNITEESKDLQVNVPLDEIWKEIAKDVEPSLTETIHNLIYQVLKSVTEYASLNEIFLA